MRIIPYQAETSLRSSYGVNKKTIKIKKKAILTAKVTYQGNESFGGDRGVTWYIKCKSGIAKKKSTSKKCTIIGKKKGIIKVWAKTKNTPNKKSNVLIIKVR